MFITGDQLVAHFVGDYILQSHWMATEKTKRTVAALAHALCYTLPFLLLTQSPAALGVIAGTHFVIDRWRLARYIVWLKNIILAPVFYRGVWVGTHPVEWCWENCAETGYPKDTPAWLAVWLLIIADNTMHILCNAAALNWLA